MHVTSRSKARLFTAVIAAGLLTAALAGPTMAGKGSAGTGGGHKSGGGGGGTISAPVMVVDNNGNGAPNWGDVVTFNISTTATTQPWVHLSCSQNGVVVASGWDGYFSGSLTSTSFGLYSPSWTGGAASCTASLTDPNWNVLASTKFSVGS